MRELRNVVIVGAGAMGCLFAARLQETGASATLIDTNVERLSIIEKQGLKLIDDAGERLTRPAAMVAAKFGGPADVVLLFTKGMHSGAAARSVAHLAQTQPIAVTLQNGLGNAEVLAETFGGEHVLMGTAHLPADFEGANTVVTRGFAHVHLGGFTPAAQSYAEPVAALLSRAGFQATATSDAQAAVWEKLAFNAALNAMAMITHANNGEMNTPGGQRIAQAVVHETVAVAKAHGITLDAKQIETTVGMAFTQHSKHKASMLQDREGGRATEIESINGAISRVGEQHGVATPVNTTLADLVRIIESRSLAGHGAR